MTETDSQIPQPPQPDLESSEQPQPQPEPRPAAQQQYQQAPAAQPQYQQQSVSYGEKSKIAAGILGILLGALGIHKFYLGYTKEGVIMLLVSILTLGLGACVMGIFGLIEGIIYLTKSDYDFYQIYEVGHKGWF